MSTSASSASTTLYYNMSSILEKLDEIEQRFARIEQRLDDIQGSTGRMDAHIDFVTRTYMYLRAPLNVFKGLTDRFGGALLSAKKPDRLLKTPSLVGDTKPDRVARHSDRSDRHLRLHSLLEDDAETELDCATDVSLPMPPSDQYPYYDYKGKANRQHADGVVL